MESRAKILGHPIHQMLIPFPIGLLGTGLLFDLIAHYTNRANLHWAANAMIVAGIIAGLLAAVFGAIDWLEIPGGTRAKRIGLVHGLGNVLVVALFAVAWFMRRDNVADPSSATVVIEAIGLAGALVTSWLGGELVDRLGVGVYPGAYLNAPSSISGRPVNDPVIR